MKLYILTAAICLASIGELVVARHSNLNEWLQYKQQHGKVYVTPEEDALRFSMFLTSKERINQHNSDQSSSYKLGLNHFSDWTPNELAQLTGSRFNVTEHKILSESAKSSAFLQSILDDPTPIPAEVDWRKVPNRVGAVKNIGKGCESSYAFAATGALEGRQVASNPNRTLIPLSEQNLIDCISSNDGCKQIGRIDFAFAELGSNGGIESEEDYPYEAKDGKCRFLREKAVMTDANGLILPQGDELVLKKVVARFGPVAMYMHAPADFPSYKSGVYNNPDCNGGLNFAVLVVGYGSEQGLDYWIMKNAWGPQWGENGYFRIARGSSMCKVGLFSTIPYGATMINS